MRRKIARRSGATRAPPPAPSAHGMAARRWSRAAASATRAPDAAASASTSAHGDDSAAPAPAASSAASHIHSALPVKPCVAACTITTYK